MGLFHKMSMTVPTILFIGVVIILGRSLSLNSDITSVLIDKPAPIFELPSLTDASQTVSNKDFIGQITLLNVWATWCYSCTLEHDFLMQLSHDKNIKLMGLNYKDDPKRAKELLEQNGNPFTQIAVDMSGNTAINWGVYGTPETFLIDQKGIVRYKHVGALSPQVWADKIEPLILKVRNEIQ
jgi:cytochrome c biogenesis protein CcmG/thiol:disulfide interchange protein DsbE